METRKSRQSDLKVPVPASGGWAIGGYKSLMM